MSDKKALLQAIAKEEAQLSRLDSEREQALSRLSSYKQQLAALEAACAEPSITYTTRTSQEKVSLFRSLFRGREDLFPKLWTNRAGKKGYSPTVRMIGSQAPVGRPVSRRSSVASATIVSSFLSPIRSLWITFRVVM